MPALAHMGYAPGPGNTGGGGGVGGAAGNIPLTPQNIVKIIRWLGGRRDTDSLVPGVSFPGYDAQGNPIDDSTQYQYADYHYPDWEDAISQQIQAGSLTLNDVQNLITTGQTRVNVGGRMIDLHSTLLRILMRGGLNPQEANAGGSQQGTQTTTGSQGGQPGSGQPNGGPEGSGTPGSGSPGGTPPPGGRAPGAGSGTNPQGFFQQYIAPYLPLAISSALQLWGASSAANASKEAAEIQRQSIKEALQLEREQFEQTRNDLAPWRRAGGHSLRALSHGLGLPDPMSEEGNRFDVPPVSLARLGPGTRPRVFPQDEYGGLNFDAVARRYQRGA